MTNKSVFWAKAICPECGSSWVLLNIRQIAGLSRNQKDDLYFCLDCKHKWESE